MSIRSVLQPIVPLLFVLAASAPAGRAQPVPAQGNEVLAELRKLRLEILEYRIESRAENIERLEQALNVVRSERLRLQDEESARIRQIAETEAYLAAQAQALTAEQRTQFEAVKAGLIGEHPDKLRMEIAAIERREAEAQDRLRAVHQQLQELKAKRNELMARQSP